MSNVPLPRPGPLGLIQYAGVDMLQYAAAVSAAKDAEIAQLRADLIKSLADNKKLRERARVLEDALRSALSELDMPPSWANIGNACLITRAALEQKP